MSQPTTEDIKGYIQTVNKNLPVHRLWDGFWIEKFKGNNLVISASFDMIYYKEYDIVFKKVTFFNLPPTWRDTNVIGDDLIRLASREEFELYHPSFDPGDRHIFAIDLWYDSINPTEKHTFFVVAANVFLFECKEDGKEVEMDYEDPLGGGYKIKQNRVPLLKALKNADDRGGAAPRDEDL